MLEILLAVLLLFLVSLYLMSLYASGQGFALRGREYTAATFLARNRMEELVAEPADALTGARGAFPSPHDGYSWEVRLEDYEGDLKVLEVAVRSPRGARSVLRTLRRTNAFHGVACDPAAQQVVFSSPGDGPVHVLVEGEEALPLGGERTQAGGVAGFPGLGLLWVTEGGGVQYFRGDGAGTLGEGVLVDPPRGLARVPRFAGAATDGAGNRLFLADRANRGLWILEDASPFGRTWDARSPLAPEDPPLGTPAGLAVDRAGSVAWVADTEYECLRMLVLGAGRRPSPAADFEEEPGLGWWCRRRFRPPEGMGAPQGVAVNPWGSAVLAVDGRELHLLEFRPRAGGGHSESWNRVALPEALVAARPSGICLDPFRNVVYLNTRAGEVWKHTVAPPGSFLRIQGASGG